MNTQQIAVRNEEETREGLPVENGALTVQASLAVSLARAEIDQQVATSRALPRSIQRAVNNIVTLATLDEETAAECIYALPRGGKTIRGPSIRFAEIMASQWGNCRVGARVVHVDRIEEYVEAEGVFHDLETNVAQTARVRRQIQRKRGKGIDADMIQLAGAAACSIARRNAILAGIPKGVARKGYIAVEEVIKGDIKTLSERRALAIKAFGVLGVTPERLFATLGIAGEDDINLDHLMTLTGARSAIKNGELTVEEAFPVIKPNGDPPKSLGERLGNLAADPPHDPETGEIKEHSSPATVSTPAAERGQAAAGEETPVETGAGAKASSGEPAPDPRTRAPNEQEAHMDAYQYGTIPASGGPPSDVSRDEASNGRGAGGAVERPSNAPADGPTGRGERPPQTGGEASPGASPPATSTLAENAVLADLIARGNAAAAEGPAAILNFLGDLPKATKAMLPDGQILSWNRTADRKARK